MEGKMCGVDSVKLCFSYIGGGNEDDSPNCCA